MFRTARGRFTVPAMALRVKEIRRTLRISQQTLADKAGLSRSQLAEIENETEAATPRRLESIAAALGVPVHELFTTDARDAYRGEIEVLMRQMSEQDQQALLRMARAMARASGTDA